MHSLIFILLRRIRLPLFILISIYACSILGFTLIPGRDDQGNVWNMSFFHAFYFVSFMGSTIGFGEIPYEFTNAQRMWAIFTIYFSVISWIYSIGAVLATLQDSAFKRVVREHNFSRKVKHLKRPFYLICGYGDTGSLLAHEMSLSDIQSVVIDLKQDRIDVLEIEEQDMIIPAFCANAGYPESLELAGLKHPFCKGVVALTDEDQVNLKIAITSKLLNPELLVICRAESHETETNMASFRTNYIINPFERFAPQVVACFPFIQCFFDL